MHQLINHSQTCHKHNKQSLILVVPQAKYICEDCAIFEPVYRHQCLLQKQSIQSQVEQISKCLSQLFQQEKSIGRLSQQKMNSLIRSIEHMQVSLINDINNQFMEVKMKVSELFMNSVECSFNDQGNGKTKLIEISRETSLQQKLRKYHESQKDLDNLKRSMNNEATHIQKVFQAMKQQMEQTISLKFDVMSSFQPVMKLKIANNKQQLNQLDLINTDDNLLDFSEFSILQIPVLEPQYTSHTTAPIQSAPFMKRNKVERMKTAACLQDSICSIESLSKSIQSQAFTINVSQIDHNNLNESLLSDRSISCSSTVSRRSIMPPVIFTAKEIKQPSKKSVIQIAHANQLQTKLLSISPTVKSIRLINIPLTSQEFSQLLKQKISRSFIHTLEISHCPKLSDKILLDLKTHKCKTLKKVQIKDCKEFNWNDKKVKQIVKKLQSEGVKIIY